MKYLLLLLLLLPGPAFAQSNVKGSADTTKPIAAAHALSTAQMSELDYYKKLYEQADKASESAITNTWSALGVVIGAVGFILLANYRLNTSKIKEEVATQGAETQRTILAAVSNQVAADVLASQNRIQELERQLRASINRELDVNKDYFLKAFEPKFQGIESEITKLSEYIATTPSLFNAQNYLSDKQYDNALISFLTYAEARIKPGSIERHVGFLLGANYLNNIDELDEGNYKRLLKLEQILKDANETGALSFLTHNMNKIKVYTVSPGGRQYIEKPTS